MNAQSTGRGLPVRLLRDAVPARLRGPLFGALGSVWYAGGRLECPCCRGSFRGFRLEGRVCPRCGSQARHRLLWLFLEARPELLESAGSLLHVGPEYCIQRQLSRLEGLRYVSADLDSPLAAEVVDVTRMPYRDGEFGAVICSHVLEHVEDDRRAMGEILRVLRPGGWAIVMAPVDPTRAVTLEDPSAVTEAERLRLFGQHDHLRLYGND